MTTSFAQFVAPLCVAALSALGGALIVYAEYDDAPGGILIGMLLIGAAAVFGAVSAQRKGS